MNGLGKLAEGLAGAGAAYVQGKEQRSAIQRKAAEDKLATRKTQAQLDSGMPEQEIEVLKQQNQNLLDKFAMDDTSTAIKRYNLDAGNPKRFNHLNSVLSTNKQVQDLMQATEVAAIDLTNDQALLRENGLKVEDFTTGPNADAFNHRFVKSRHLDGTWGIADTFAEAQVSGVLNRMTADEYEQAVRKNDVSGTGEGLTAFQKNVRAVAEATGRPESEIYTEKHAASISGVTGGKQIEAEKAEQEYMDSGFLAKSITDLSQEEQIRASQIVRRIEEFGGKGLSNTAKEDLRQVKKLVSLGAQFTDKMSPAATGAFDRLQGGVGKYTSLVPEVDKHLAQAAYLAYRNVMLKYMSGAAVTTPEANRFIEAFGSLNQRYTPVITQFKSSLARLRDDLMAITETESPIMTHYYVGASLDTVKDSIYDINQQLEFIEGLEKKGQLSEENIQKGLDKGRGKPPASVEPSTSAVPANSLAQRILAKKEAKKLEGAQ